MRRTLALLLFALVIVGGALTVPTARSASPDVVVSQVFAGGGNCGRAVHERLRRALQPRVGRGRRRRLDDPVRVRSRRELAGDGPDRLDRARPALPRPARVRQPSAGRCRRPTRPARPTSPSRAGRSRSCVSATLLTCGASAGSCAGAASRRRPDRLRRRGGLRGQRGRRAQSTTRPRRPVRPTAVPTPTTTRRTSPRRRRRRGTRRARRPRAATPPPSGGVSTSATVDVDVQAVLSIALERSERQLRERDDGQYARAGLREGDGGEQRQRRLLAHRPSHGVRSRRSAARHRGNRPERRPDRRRTCGGRDGSGSDRARRPTCSSARRPRPAAGAGDVWNTRLGFASPIPSVPAGRYTTTVTFTVIGR